MNVTITGASGLIGTRLTEVLSAAGHSVRGMGRKDAPEKVLAGADAVVHLAGEPVAQRWTPQARHRILESRGAGTERLVREIAALKRRPTVLVSASAVGYYGSRDDEVLTEKSPPGSGFLPRVCIEWERAADAAAFLNVRVVKLRIGVVLARRGGALRKMLLPFRLGLGGTLGSGGQWMSWIHLDDLVSLIRFALEKPVLGVFNATSPNPVTNAEFTRTLARVLHRPAIFPVPAPMLRALFGEMSTILLESQRALPRAALDAGFACAHPELFPALQNILSS